MNIKLNRTIIMLPLKLEIRRIDTQVNPDIKMTSYTIRKHESSSDLHINELSIGDIKSLQMTEVQYWIRWYPDENQLPYPVGKITDEELEELGKLKDLIYGSEEDANHAIPPFINLDDLNDEEIKKAFLEYVKNVRSPARALQIIRDYEIKNGQIEEGIDNWDFDSENVDDDSDQMKLLMKGITFPLIPRKICLYTVNKGEAMLLMEDIPVKKDKLLISTVDIDDSNWITDFSIALENGMGVVIKDEDKIDMLQKAEWLVAVGVNDDDGSEMPKPIADFENILKRSNARGELSLIPQDTPTNNTDATKSPYKAIELDAIEYFKKAGYFNGGDIAADDSDDLDARLLSEAFGVNDAVFNFMPDNNLKEQKEAEAIARVLWDSCTNVLCWLWGGQEHFDYIKDHWNDLRSFFCDFVRARGPLPALRIGKNPYGILPVFSFKDRINLIEDDDTGIFKNKLSVFFNFLKNQFLDLSNNVPKIGREESDKRFEELLNILGLERVSSRLDVRHPKERSMFNMNEFPCNISCELVKEKKTDGSINADYIGILAGMDKNNIEALNIDDNSPVLKRLINYYLLQVINDSTMRGIDKYDALEVFDEIKESAGILKGLDPEKLEILLMEVLDLFTNRLDAWITGLATKRMKEDCQGLKPAVGVYGWLELSGADLSVSTAAEYIQTPSEAQASAAAILRNAAINNGNDGISGPFRINLSSLQVRKGLWYLESLRQGHLPEELLGYQLERLIHESNGDINESDIYTLRDSYPLKLQETLDEDGENTAVMTVINGIAFLDNNTDDKFADLRNRLNQIRDAASDLSLAEVIYQFVRGNNERAAAWLDYLDGNCMPPELEFIRTHRTGNSYGTKVFLLVPEPLQLNSESELNVSVMIDPALANLCNILLPDYNGMQLVVKIYRSDGEASREIILSPFYDLRFKPVDLVIGGIEELTLRVRYYILKQWQNNDPENATSPYNILGDFPGIDSSGGGINELKVELINSGSEEREINISEYIEKAKKIKKMFSRNKSLGNSVSMDSNIMPLITESSISIDRDKSIEILLERAESIRVKINSLAENIDSIINTYENYLSITNDFVSLEKELGNIIKKYKEGNEINQEIENHAAGINSISDNLDDFDEIYEKMQELLEDIEGEIQNNDEIIDLLYQFKEKESGISLDYKEAMFESIRDFSISQNCQNLMNKLIGFGYYQASILLNSLNKTGEISAALTMLKDILNDLNERNEKIRKYLDSENADAYAALLEGTRQKSMIIFTPYLIGEEIFCNLNFSELNLSVDSIESRFNEFKQVRKDVKTFVDVFNNINSIRLYKNNNDTGNSSNSNINGDYFYLTFSDSPESVSCYSCLALDEWQEFFPGQQKSNAELSGQINDKESTGIALRYGSPQAEAPNAIIIAVPPFGVDESKKWTNQMIANTLSETIDLLKIRMISSNDIIGSNDLGRYLPALLLGTDENNEPLFPSFPKLLADLKTGEAFYYMDGNHLSSEQLQQTKIICSRNNESETGGER